MVVQKGIEGIDEGIEGVGEGSERTGARAAARARGVTAVRVRHILVQTAEMANELRRAVASGSAKFDQLAGMASGCAATRDKGGEVGWSGVDDEHLDEILPR